MANRQTIASKKYQDKIGLIPKTYKLKKELTDRFSEECTKRGVSQSAILSLLMEEWIREGNK